MATIHVRARLMPFLSTVLSVNVKHDAEHAARQVHSHNVSEASTIETLRINETVRNDQMKRLREVKKSRMLPPCVTL